MCLSLSLVLALLVAPASVALGQVTIGTIITGAAEVEDADILVIDGTRIVLWGIDAPERRQSCTAPSGKWGCFEAAMRTLEMLVDQREVACTIVHGPDRFGTLFGVCDAAGKSVNEELVRSGMALGVLEQTDEYEPLQDEAKQAKTGLWQDGVTFHEPWVWRAAMTPGGHR